MHAFLLSYNIHPSIQLASEVLLTPCCVWPSPERGPTLPHHGLTSHEWGGEVLWIVVSMALACAGAPRTRGTTCRRASHATVGTIRKKGLSPLLPINARQAKRGVGHTI